MCILTIWLSPCRKWSFLNLLVLGQDGFFRFDITSNSSVSQCPFNFWFLVEADVYLVLRDVYLRVLVHSVRGGIWDTVRWCSRAYILQPMLSLRSSRILADIWQKICLHSILRRPWSTLLCSKELLYIGVSGSIVLHNNAPLLLLWVDGHVATSDWKRPVDSANPCNVSWFIKTFPHYIVILKVLKLVGCKRFIFLFALRSRWHRFFLKLPWVYLTYLWS